MISKYETLAKVVELGSLTRAAEALGCTQSAVSHAINGLEKEFGFAVLTRSRAGVHLTADGERIMPSIRGMLNYEEQLKQTSVPCASAHSPPLPSTGCRASSRSSKGTTQTWI